MNLKAKISYKNKHLETIREFEYDLQDYMDTLSQDMKRIISDVEDMMYRVRGGDSKNDWTEEERLAFEKIRHKLLDKAGELTRLPSCIYDVDAEEEQNMPSAFWGKVFGNKGV